MVADFAEAERLALAMSDVEQARERARARAEKELWERHRRAKGWG